MLIRTATIDDLDAIAAVEAECFPAAEAATKKALIKYVDTVKEHNETKNDRIASLENLLNKGRYD